MSVTIKQVAKASGLSWPTVSRILNNSHHPCREETRQRVRQIAEQMGYRPHAGARMMRNRKSQQVGVMVTIDPVSNLTHHLAMEAIMGVNHALLHGKYSMVLIPVARTAVFDEIDVPAIREHLLDGLVIMDSIPDCVMAEGAARFRNTVWVNTNRFSQCWCVQRDERQAGRCAAGALADLGYRDLIYVQRPSGSHYSYVDRHQGVREVAEERGLTLRIVNWSLPPHVVVPPHPWDVRGCGVIAGDYYVARAMQSYLLEEGLRPGSDFALASADDSDVLGHTWQDLARVRFDRFRAGVIAGEMLIARLSGEPPRESVRIVPEWIPGGTARARETANSGASP